EAERIEREINKKGYSPSDAERYLRDQKFGPLFELDQIAQRIPPKEVLAARKTEYLPYRIPEEKAAEFRYPPDDLVKQLLTLEKPGSAMVLVDKPARNFYVAVALNRDEPSISQFKKLYSRTPDEDTLWERLVQERSQEYRDELLKQLRREAGK